ncbi:hypothetical protein [Nocardioides sp. J54]|uniref:hypothetical protein n=1 Tax=Nocardioides sp. J54 TaxID=935866 RepID=UPI00048C31E9|nr:hypothetical protein [Nocardioides sp. J54]
MTAEILRRAAAGIRQDATEVPDRTVVDHRVNGVWLNSVYYLTTTPAVALAVADWLDAEAGHADDWFDPEPAALAVARAYLGEAADA